MGKKLSKKVGFGGKDSKLVDPTSDDKDEGIFNKL
jgi:hypothetical protein